MLPRFTRLDPHPPTPTPTPLHPPPTQVQFGYTSLEEIFRDESRASVGDLISLLFAKIAATSVCAGAGLVGGGGGWVRVGDGRGGVGVGAPLRT